MKCEKEELFLLSLREVELKNKGEMSVKIANIFVTIFADCTSNCSVVLSARSALAARILFALFAVP